VRLDDARGAKTGGTGLGLSIAKTAIENHGGQIFLENSDLGGLRVRVVLPI
jgi:two-component system osmolarity sensor histidine kinase EnvZ